MKKYIIDSTLATVPGKGRDVFMFGWRCTQCVTRVPAGEYETRRRAMREALEHFVEMHTTGQPRRAGQTFGLGYRVGWEGLEIPKRQAKYPSFVAGHEEGVADRLALQNDYDLTDEERREVDSIGSSNA